MLAQEKIEHKLIKRKSNRKRNRNADHITQNGSLLSTSNCSTVGIISSRSATANTSSAEYGDKLDKTMCMGCWGGGIRTVKRKQIRKGVITHKLELISLK